MRNRGLARKAATAGAPASRRTLAVGNSEDNGNAVTEDKVKGKGKGKGFEEECVRDGRKFEIEGMENFFQFTRHSLAARMQDAILIKEQARRSEREVQMEQLAEQYKFDFQSDILSAFNIEDFVYMRRGSDKEENNSMTGDYMGCKIHLSDYSHTSPPDYYSKHWHTIVTLRCPPESTSTLPDLVITPGHYLERYLVDFKRVDGSSHQTFAEKYHLYTKDGADPIPNLSPKLIEFIVKYDDFYIEVSKGVMLAFRRHQALANADDIAALFSLAEIVNDSCITAKND